MNQVLFHHIPNALFVFSTGTILFQLQASDPENDNLTYSLYDGVAQSLFTIDPTTGQLFLKAILDREVRIWIIHLFIYVLFVTVQLLSLILSY